MDTGKFHDLRQTYDRHRLQDASVAKSPFQQFSIWFQEALLQQDIEANAMVISTLSESGRLSSRTVLLKSFDQRGFVFYTNYHSQKGRDIAYHPWVSLTFFWEKLQRQVHIQGKAEKVADAESDAYFAERPFGHQVGAWVSPQSQVIPNRAYLEERAKELEAKFHLENIARPPHWGGYLVVPENFEFWQGRPNRLHDRITYRRDDNGNWDNLRLAP